MFSLNNILNIIILILLILVFINGHNAQAERTIKMYEDGSFTGCLVNEPCSEGIKQ